MCSVCGVTDGGKHHYYCPYGGGKVKTIATENEAKNQYKNYFKWRRDDGEYYIMHSR